MDIISHEECMKSDLSKRAYIGFDYLIDFVANTDDRNFEDYVKTVMMYVHYLEAENSILRRRLDNERS